MKFTLNVVYCAMSVKLLSVSNNGCVACYTIYVVYFIYGNPKKYDVRWISRYVVILYRWVSTALYAVPFGYRQFQTIHALLTHTSYTQELLNSE